MIEETIMSYSEGSEVKIITDKELRRMAEQVIPWKFYKSVTQIFDEIHDYEFVLLEKGGVNYMYVYAIIYSIKVVVPIRISNQT